ncbi:MAG: hypothetical protein QM661_12900, partial [Solimonas sp.]
FPLFPDSSRPVPYQVSGYMPLERLQVLSLFVFLRRQGKALSLGTYPDGRLSPARERRDEARRLVAAGTERLVKAVRHFPTFTTPADVARLMQAIYGVGAAVKLSPPPFQRPARFGAWRGHR